MSPLVSCWGPWYHLMTFSSWGPFHQGFFYIVVQIRWKLLLAILQFLNILSLQSLSTRWRLYNVAFAKYQSDHFVETSWQQKTEKTYFIIFLSNNPFMRITLHWHSYLNIRYSIPVLFGHVIKILENESSDIYTLIFIMYQNRTISSKQWTQWTVISTSQYLSNAKF